MAGIVPLVPVTVTAMKTILCEACQQPFVPNRKGLRFCKDDDCVSHRSSTRSLQSKSKKWAAMQQLHPVVAIRPGVIQCSQSELQDLRTLCKLILDPAHPSSQADSGIDRLQGAARNTEVYFKLPDDKMLPDSEAAKRLYFIDELNNESRRGKKKNRDLHALMMRLKDDFVCGAQAMLSDRCQGRFAWRLVNGGLLVGGGKQCLHIDAPLGLVQVMCYLTYPCCTPTQVYQGTDQYSYADLIDRLYIPAGSVGDPILNAAHPDTHASNLLQINCHQYGKARQLMLPRACMHAHVSNASVPAPVKRKRKGGEEEAGEREGGYAAFGSMILLEGGVAHRAPEETHPQVMKQYKQKENARMAMFAIAVPEHLWNDYRTSAYVQMVPGECELFFACIQSTYLVHSEDPEEKVNVRSKVSLLIESSASMTHAYICDFKGAMIRSIANMPCGRVLALISAFAEEKLSWRSGTHEWDDVEIATMIAVCHEQAVKTMDRSSKIDKKLHKWADNADTLNRIARSREWSSNSKWTLCNEMLEIAVEAVAAEAAPVAAVEAAPANAAPVAAVEAAAAKAKKPKKQRKKHGRKPPNQLWTVAVALETTESA